MTHDDFLKELADDYADWTNRPVYDGGFYIPDNILNPPDHVSKYQRLRREWIYRYQVARDMLYEIKQSIRWSIKLIMNKEE